MLLSESDGSSHRRCSVNKGRPEGLQFYSKEIPTKVFSCEICDIFKNTYFEEDLQTTASEATFFMMRALKDFLLSGN